MYHVIRSVINAGGYKLEDIRHKVKKMHILGDLTEGQMDELLTLAAGGADPEAERPEVRVSLQRLSARVEALAAEIAALKGSPGEEASESWESWDGISDKYQPGSVVSHGGRLWISVYAGQNVWEPGVAGARFWEEYTGV